MRQRLHPLQHLRRPGVQLVGVGILQRVLVQRARQPPADIDVLRRLHVQLHARHRLRLLCDSRAITFITSSPGRWSHGLRLMYMRPSLPCCPPVPAPTCEANDATAGIMLQRCR